MAWSSMETGTENPTANEAPRRRRILVVDDLLATGGTAAAAGRLIERLGGQLEGFAFMVELGFLGGRKNLDKDHVFSLLHYE